MKLFSILFVAVSLFGVSCERHEFEGPEGTKRLHEHHGAGEHHAAPTLRRLMARKQRID